MQRGLESWQRGGVRVSGIEGTVPLAWGRVVRTFQGVRVGWFQEGGGVVYLGEGFE